MAKIAINPERSWLTAGYLWRGAQCGVQVKGLQSSGIERGPSRLNYACGKRLCAAGRAARATSTRRPSGRRGNKEQAAKSWNGHRNQAQWLAFAVNPSHNPGRLAKPCSRVNRSRRRSGRVIIESPKARKWAPDSIQGDSGRCLGQGPVTRLSTCYFVAIPPKMQDFSQLPPRCYHP